MMLIDILLIILILLASSLIVYLIITLKKLNQSIGKLNNDVSRLIETTIPVLENLDAASKKAVSVAEDAERHMKNLTQNYIRGFNRKRRQRQKPCFKLNKQPQCVF